MPTVQDFKCLHVDKIGVYECDQLPTRLCESIIGIEGPLAHRQRILPFHQETRSLDTAPHRQGRGDKIGGNLAVLLQDSFGGFLRFQGQEGGQGASSEG